MVSEDDALAAMCIWEYAMEDHVVYQWLEQGEGACQARDNALALAPYANQAWLKAKEQGYDDPFDWEFVPWFVSDVMCHCPVPEMDARLAFLIGVTIGKSWKQTEQQANGSPVHGA